ncbi:sugar-transfer associated ATP-grasp domain-containing protein [Butyrivibrio sp. AE3004]|uniref:sugar-transfer associated ATP-grasp domain-containing protein n=1 Tax=Butyrivibrio sp. AE3004 TaxID=1506994 RepID=UPI0004948AAA|nr:sugar-transfer associated ATP-grasp domain-containing protein [Butyrivibrio sp. AE3004]
MGIFNKGYSIPFYSKVCDAVASAHTQIPHLKLIGWDFTVDTEGNPVMLEYNAKPDVGVQIVTAQPYFRDLTDQILDDYFFERTLSNNQKQGRLVQ